MKKLWYLPALTLILFGCQTGEPIGPDDLKEMKAAHMQYAAAWLTNNPEEVLNTLTHDPIIVPSGMSAIEGKDAVREFWWPEGNPGATITRFDLVQEQAGGHGELGYVRGTFTLEFEYEGEPFRNEGEFVSLMEYEDRGWKIATHMWNDSR